MEDARVALLESVCAAVVLHVGSVPVGGSPAESALQNPVPVSVEWAQLDAVDLPEELLTRVPMLKSCPHWLRGMFREGLSVALRERHRAKLANDELRQIRAWKPFYLVPKMLLHRPRNRRVTEFQQGHWGAVDSRSQRVQISVNSCPNTNTRGRSHARGSGSPEQSAKGTGFKSSARVDGSYIGTPFTGDALKSQRRQSQVWSWTSNPQALSSWTRTRSRSVCGKPSGCSPGPGRCTNEMLRVCLDDHELFQLLFSASEDFARGTGPSTVGRAGGGQRNRKWHGFSEARGQVFGTTIWQDCGISVLSIPVPFVHMSM